jgi:hypothetical protein
MQRMLIALAGVIVLASPALSQNWSRWDDRDSSDHEDRGRSKRDYPRWHDMDDHHGSGRGARFMVRSGDSAVAVRCDGSESMRSCVDATLVLLERVRSSSPGTGSSPGAGGPQAPPR